MRYTRFDIENFRGIKSLSLELDRQPSNNVFTLVGLNESGKSTILHALHWFRQSVPYNPHDLIPKALKANFDGSISVGATLELSDADEDEIRSVAARFGVTLTKSIGTLNVTRRYTYQNSTCTKRQQTWNLSLYGKLKRGKLERSFDFGHPVWTAIADYVGERMFPPIIYYENFLFDFPDQIYLERAGAETETDDPHRAVIQDVLNSLGMKLEIEKHLVQRYRSGKRNDLDNIQAVLDEASAQITDVVITAWREIVKKQDQPLSVSLGSSVQEDEDGKLYLQLKVREGKQTYYIRERSLGFRWFFSFVLFTHFRTYRDNQRENALFLLDEPASNLHPAAQTKLLSAFAALPNNQIVVYSTHSHHMIRPDWLAGTFVVRNAGHDYASLDLSYNAAKTEIEAERYFRYVAAHPHDTDLYRPILDALDFKPSPLERIPDLIIVEGKNDYYSLLYYAKVIAPATLKYPNVYPSTGNDKTDDIVALYLGWGRRFTVMLDADKGGRETAERLKRMYGVVTATKIFTLEDVDSTWKDKSLEDLFTEEDQVSVIQSLYPSDTTYKKSKFNTALQAAFLNSRQLDLSEGTKQGFRKLIAFLNSAIDGA